MKVTPWPMNTSSSMVTPSQTNVWLEILQLLTDLRVLLNLDERADLRLVADLTAVQVDELGKLHALAQLAAAASCSRPPREYQELCWRLRRMQA
jgi:hypothetical protein